MREFTVKDGEPIPRGIKAYEYVLIRDPRNRTTWFADADQYGGLRGVKAAWQAEEDSKRGDGYKYKLVGNNGCYTVERIN